MDSAEERTVYDTDLQRMASNLQRAEEGLSAVGTQLFWDLEDDTAKEVRDAKLLVANVRRWLEEMAVDPIPF